MTTLVKPKTLFIGLSLLCVLAIWLSLALGPVSLPLVDTLRAALKLMGVPIEAQGLEQAELILGQIRLPRTLLGLAVGGVLALSGVAMQGLFRNPLADPGLVGVSSGAALGAAVVFNIGASTGGTDIIAMILHKYTSLEIGRALLVSDIGIVLWAAYLYGSATGLYCILGMILKSTVVDNAIESLNLRKVCTVVTSNPDCIRDFIVSELHRSATEERAVGAFTHEEKWALMTVLTRQQAQMLRNFIRIGREV